MPFDSPVAFEEALESREARSLLPTEFRTRELAALEPEIRERAIFSAGVTSAEFLQDAENAIAEILDGDLDLPTARLRMQEFLAAAGADDPDARLGTDLRSLSSIRRQNLILETNAAMARGYGQYKRGADPVALETFPAQELIRVEPRENVRSWESRWSAAGGTIYPGRRMVALKASGIWSAISRFGLPYPPFDFNSGMGVRAVKRSEAEGLGLLEVDEAPPAPAERPFNRDLQSSPSVRSAALRAALTEALRGLASFTANGVLRFDR